MAKMNKFRALIAETNSNLQELQDKMSEIEGKMCWHRLEGDKPKLKLCPAEEPFKYDLRFVYGNMELPLRAALEEMEEYGYVTPDNFF